jgi:hypothetical protein
MKKIKSFILGAMVMAMVAPVFTACGDDDKSETINNLVSEYEVNDKMVAAQKAASKKDVAVLLVAFGSTWDNAFKAFDKTKAAYEAAFPEADVYVCFSSDICINRASAGENVDDNGKIVKRDYYEPRYLLHAIGAAKYSKIYVQSLQVIPGEEFAAVVVLIVQRGTRIGGVGEAVELAVGIAIAHDISIVVPFKVIDGVHLVGLIAVVGSHDMQTLVVVADFLIGESGGVCAVDEIAAP